MVLIADAGKRSLVRGSLPTEIMPQRANETPKATGRKARSVRSVSGENCISELITHNIQFSYR